MTVRLRPLREDEFAGYRGTIEAGYAADIERNGGMPRELAQAKSKRDCEALWPDGLRTPGQWVFVVEDDGGESVGTLAVARRDSQGREVLFVYDVRIDERHRGRGLGREAMRLAEEEARSRGLDRIELNVFGGNDAARGLYRSLGYGELAVWMGKDLA